MKSLEPCLNRVFSHGMKDYMLLFVGVVLDCSKPQRSVVRHLSLGSWLLCFIEEGVVAINISVTTHIYGYGIYSFWAGKLILDWITKNNGLLCNWSSRVYLNGEMCSLWACTSLVMLVFLCRLTHTIFPWPFLLVTLCFIFLILIKLYI